MIDFVPLGALCDTGAPDPDFVYSQTNTDKTKLKLDREVGGGDLVLNGGAEV